MTRSLLTLAALVAAAPALAQSDTDAVLDMGRERTEAFYAGETDAIWADMSADMQAVIGSPDGLGGFRDSVMGDLGTETTILDETVTHAPAAEVYTRIGQWSGSDTPIVVEWGFGPEGAIVGFSIQPQAKPADSAYLDYQTQADLRLPFDGQWYVFWGGRDIADNYHAVDPAQRFAADFVVLENGRSYTGDPERLESYHCWGRDILAPADAEVVAAVDDFPDLAIGDSDPAHPAGNHVVLATGDSEYIFLAHLQQGSVTVAEGDRVAQGDVLGLCGNSGNTSEPHLHLHMQTTPDLTAGEGLPAQFQNYTADGEAVERGEPLRGEIVAPQ